MVWGIRAVASMCSVRCIGVREGRPRCGSSWPFLPCSEVPCRVQRSRRGAPRPSPTGTTVACGAGMGLALLWHGPGSAAERDDLVGEQGLVRLRVVASQVAAGPAAVLEDLADTDRPQHVLESQCVLEVTDGL